MFRSPNIKSYLLICIVLVIVACYFILSPRGQNEQAVPEQSQLQPLPRCPEFVPSSHPDFVCPPEVLAKRNPLALNHTLEYQKLGGPERFPSQFFEDWFVYSEFFYSEKYKSVDYTFIELGGYDGRTGSNSWFFDKVLGWKGVLLEASTPNYVLMEKLRLSDRVETIHGGVCTKPKLLALFGGASLTANNRKEAGPFFHGNEETRCVCLRMSQYLDMIGMLGNRTINRIDYFSIDVEGQELEVILSHDWVRYPVFVVSIEVAVQPLLSGTAEYQHEKRCSLFQRGLCRWPYYDNFYAPVSVDPSVQWLNNEIWVNPSML